MSFIPPNPRNLTAGDMFEREAERRLNPFGPARPDPSQRPPEKRGGGFWRRLFAWWPIGQREVGGPEED